MDKSIDDYIQRIGGKGHCQILFQNVNGISKEEIARIFSAFGTVLDVKETGNETGYRFVNYETVDAAQKALQVYLENENFLFKVPRKSAKHNQVSKNKENLNDSAFNNSRSYSGPVWEHEVNGASPQSIIATVGHGWSGPNDSTPRKKNQHGRFNHDHNKANVNKPTDSATGSSVRNKYYDQRGRSNFNKEKIDASRPIDNATGSVKSENVAEEENIPDLESSSSKGGRKMKVSEAQQVVVGNIPSRYGAAYILHLFESFEPFGVSVVEKLPDTNVRYCYVYFKSNEDALQVESKYDKFTLDGQKLIVLRYVQLREEARVV